MSFSSEILDQAREALIDAATQKLTLVGAIKEQGRKIAELEREVQKQMTGRVQAEALAAYREAHRVLTEEFGLDPGEQLAALERAILTNDPALNKSDAASVMHPVPRQLPAAVSDFVGRDEIAGELCARLTDASGTQGRSVEVIIISGAGGIGKTALLDQFRIPGRAAGRTPVSIDAREIDCSAAGLSAALHRITGPVNGSEHRAEAYTPGGTA